MLIGPTLATPSIFRSLANPPRARSSKSRPGILWTRFVLPYLLNHVNVYLIEDGDGWAAVDTGLGTDETKAAWDALLSGPLRGAKLSRIICTHFHPDHVGLVGWLAERFGIELGHAAYRISGKRRDPEPRLCGEPAVLRIAWPVRGSHRTP